MFVLRPSWGFGTASAVAAQLGRVVLFNPAASGVLARVEHVSGDVGLEGGVILGDINTDIGVGNVPDFRDSRIAGFPAVEVQTATNGVSQVVGHRLIRLPAGETVDFLTNPFILEPGTGLGVENTTLNAFVRVNFIWREENN